LDYKKGLIALLGLAGMAGCSCMKVVIHENGQPYVVQENKIEVPKYGKSKGVTKIGPMIATIECGTTVRMGNTWEYTKFDRNNDGKYDLILLEHYAANAEHPGMMEINLDKKTPEKRGTVLTMRELHEDEDFDGIRDYWYAQHNPQLDKGNLFASKHDIKANKQSFEDLCKSLDQNIK